MKTVAPGRYDPNVNATMRVGTSKQMLGKSDIPERKMNADEPGPGHYNLPDSFRIGEKRAVSSATVSLKPAQPQKKLSTEELEAIRKQIEENEKRLHAKHCHFGTSTRDGITLTKFDERDDKLRETHIPKSKFDDKGQLKMNIKY